MVTTVHRRLRSAIESAGGGHYARRWTRRSSCCTKTKCQDNEWAQQAHQAHDRCIDTGVFQKRCLLHELVTDQLHCPDPSRMVHRKGSSATRNWSPFSCSDNEGGCARDLVSLMVARLDSRVSHLCQNNRLCLSSR